MTEPSRIGHHRAKYQQWRERNPDADLGKPLADLDWWIADARASLDRMTTDHSAPDIIASLVDHIADLEDARTFLRGLQQT